ncbi:MAG TPA: hypothetical protein VL945_00275 [Candidatus Saccharimonadales bacterium]|nr:hypothetical protein [Candidatus Saccharimonadales bacterium]
MAGSCVCCSCPGCSGCSGSGTGCACAAAAYGGFREDEDGLKAPSGYPNRPSGGGSRIGPKEKVKIREEGAARKTLSDMRMVEGVVARFNLKGLEYKKWAVVLGISRSGEFLYEGIKEREAKRFFEASLKDLERRIDAFEAEGRLGKFLERKRKERNGEKDIL